MSLITASSRPIVYPETDGLPMAENTLQFDWIVRIDEMEAENARLKE